MQDSWYDVVGCFLGAWNTHNSCHHHIAMSFLMWAKNSHLMSFMLYYVLIRVNVIFNFQHSQWFSCSPHSFSTIMTFIKNPSKYLHIHTFPTKCSLWNVQVHHIPSFEWICWQGGFGACTSFVFFGKKWSNYVLSFLQ